MRHYYGLTAYGLTAYGLTSNRIACLAPHLFVFTTRTILLQPLCMMSDFDIHAKSLLLFLSFLSICARVVAASPKNVTIDDTFGDSVTGKLPTYTPAVNWTQGQNCDSCLVNPDPADVLNGTWHDSIGFTPEAPPRTISLDFDGYAVYVYCIISDVDHEEITIANLTFTLDGELVGSYFHDPNGSGDITYNVQVYGNPSIPNGQHTLQINSLGYSRLLFDYAMYSTNSDLEASAGFASTSSPSSSSSSNTPGPTTISNSSTTDVRSSLTSNHGLIVGAAVGGTAALLIFVALAIFLYRRSRRHINQPYHLDLIDTASPQERRYFGKGDIDDMTSGSSVELSSSITPYSSSIFSESRFQEHLDENNRATSPMDPALLMQFPLHSTSDGHSPKNTASVPRIIVTNSETRLEGPDNAMARVARAKIAAREAELTQRVREMEKTLSDKYPAAASSSTETSQSASPTDVPELRRTVSVKSDTSDSEVMSRGQVEALRAEMERMRTLQQQMVLELRDATEPPPEYQ